MFVAGALLFGVFSVLWIQKVYTGPSRVFWGMIENNLSTSGVTRRTVNEQGGQKTDQYTQLSFVDPVASHSYVDLVQGDGNNGTQVRTETIGTKDTDYSRYISIKTNQKSQDGKPLDFSKVQQVWGKSDQLGGGQYYRQAALGLVLFANLDNATALEVSNKLRQQDVYTVDYSKAKSTKVNGKSVWTYAVKLDVAKYLTVVKEYSKKLPLGNIDELDPEQYKSSPPIELSISVGKLSRQVVQIQTSDGQKEDYLSYGLKAPVELPEKTIPISDLQQRLQQAR